MKVSRKHDDGDLTWPLALEVKIDIFYEQLLGWQLHVADLIANGAHPLEGGAKVETIPDSGFAVLHICLSYFETIGKYQGVPVGRDGAQFKAGALAVLPELRASAKRPLRKSEMRTLSQLQDVSRRRPRANTKWTGNELRSR